jgi:hypothetical protein
MTAFSSLSQLVKLLLRLDRADERFTGHLLGGLLLPERSRVQDGADRVRNFNSNYAQTISRIIRKKSPGSTTLMPNLSAPRKSLQALCSK